MHTWRPQNRHGILRYLAMLAVLLSLLATLRSVLRVRAELALENLALRQQLAALRGGSWAPAGCCKGELRTRMSSRSSVTALGTRSLMPTELTETPRGLNGRWKRRRRSRPCR